MFVPCEDGHAQERSLLDDVFDDGRSRAILWMRRPQLLHDENSFFGIADHGGFFRDSPTTASTLTWKLVGDARERRGKTDKGRVS